MIVVSVECDAGCYRLWDGDGFMSRGVIGDDDGDEVIVCCSFVVYWSSCWYVDCMI